MGFIMLYLCELDANSIVLGAGADATVIFMCWFWCQFYGATLLGWVL